MRVLVFGSRSYSRERLPDGTLGEEQFDMAMDTLIAGLAERDPNLIVISGGARGADRLADQTAWKYDAISSVFPADWDKHGKAAGPIRNTQMINEGKPELAFGFIDKPLAESRGSADMARKTQGFGIPTYVIQKSS